MELKKEITVETGTVWMKVRDKYNNLVLIDFYSLGSLKYRIKKAHRIADHKIKVIKENL